MGLGTDPEQQLIKHFRTPAGRFSKQAGHEKSSGAVSVLIPLLPATTDRDTIEAAAGTEVCGR